MLLEIHDTSSIGAEAGQEAHQNLNKQKQELLVCTVTTFLKIHLYTIFSHLEVI